MRNTMDKDAYYFPHFCNARHDRKITRLRKELGIEGYGIFFMLLEVLRDQTDLKYPLDDIDLLADEFGTSEPKVRTVICNYQLFKIDEQKKFFSPKLLVYLLPYFAASEKARHAAFIRWGKEPINNDAQALPEQCSSNASKVKYSKVNESKVNESKELRTNLKTIPPTLEEVTTYCLERKNGIDPQRFIDFYDSRGWMYGKTKIKDWRAAVRLWESGNNSKLAKPGTDPRQQNKPRAYAQIQAILEEEAKNEQN